MGTAGKDGLMGTRKSTRLAHALDASPVKRVRTSAVPSPSTASPTPPQHRFKAMHGCAAPPGKALPPSTPQQLTPPKLRTPKSPDQGQGQGLKPQRELDTTILAAPGEWTDSCLVNGLLTSDNVESAESPYGLVCCPRDTWRR
jgi:hypothetical protein